MLRKTLQNTFRWIKAHSDMGKAIVLLRASKKDDSNEKIEEAIPLLYRARSEFAALKREPAYAIATFSLVDAFVGNPTGDKKKNIEQGIVLLDELLLRSIQHKDADLQLNLYSNIAELYYELFLADPSQTGSFDRLDRASEYLRKILQTVHPSYKRKIWIKTTLQLAAYLFDRYQCEAADELPREVIELLEPLLNELWIWEKWTFSGSIRYLLGKAYSELTVANVGENAEIAIGHLCSALDSGSFSDLPKTKVDIYLTLAESQILAARGTVKFKSEFTQKYLDKAEEILDVIDLPAARELMLSIKEKSLLIGIFDPSPKPDLENIKKFLPLETDQSNGISIDYAELQRWVKERRKFEMQLFAAFAVLMDMMLEMVRTAPEEKRVRYVRQIIDFDFKEITRELKTVNPDLFGTLQRKIDEFQILVESVLKLLNRQEQPIEWMSHHLSLAGTSIFKSSFGTGEDEIKEFQGKAIYHFEQALTVLLEIKSSIYLGFISRISGFPILFVNRQWKEAEMLFGAALEAQEQTYRLSLSEDGKKNALEEIGNPLFGLSSAQAYVLAQQGKIVEAVETVEKWRGRSISEYLQRDPRNLKTTDPGDYEEYCQIANRINALEAEQRNPSRRGFTTIVYELKSARKSLDDLIERIRLTHPDFMIELTFGDIRQAASADRPLAYVLTTEAGSLSIVVSDKTGPVVLWEDDFTKGTLFSILAGPNMDAPVAESIASDRSRLASEILPGCSKLIGKLFDELKRQKARGVVLIPCGTLAMLPLHAVNVEGKGCLIDHFDVHFAPSANTILSARKSLAKDLKMTPRFVGIGDPDRTLETAVFEVKAIDGFFKNEWKSGLLLYEEATLENLHKVTHDATHLHFACHGTLGNPNPLDSCLILANKEKLTLGNLLGDRRFNFLSNARLVVLSACWSASIDLTTNPEESTGMSLGFLSAGVPGVIGTLWPVYDLSSTLLMIMFYRKHICDGLDPAAALRAAQCWLRSVTREQIIEIFGESFDLSETLHKLSSREASYDFENTVTDSRYPYADPYFWAGFILIGI